MKVEIEIPPQYAQIIKAAAEKQGVSADEIVETALKNFLERSRSHAE